MESVDEQTVLEKRIKLYKVYRRRQNWKRFRREDYLRVTKEDLLERLELCVGLSEKIASEYTNKVYDAVIKKMNQPLESNKKKLLLMIKGSENAVKKQKKKLRTIKDEFMAAIVENKADKMAATRELFRDRLADLENSKDESLSVILEVFADKAMPWRQNDSTGIISKLNRLEKSINVRITLDGILETKLNAE